MRIGLCSPFVEIIKIGLHSPIFISFSTNCVQSFYLILETNMAPNAEIDQLELDNRNASKVLKAGNDWYKVLEVPQEFSSKELRKAYLAAELKVHPDKNKSPDATEASQKVKEAYR